MARKFRSFILMVLVATLVCGLVWAALELSGQSNKSAADAGSSAADMEMASLDSIKPSTSAPEGANQETAIRNKIQQADSAYKKQLAKAKSEINANGKVSESTRSAGMSAAHKYKAANDEYAAYWDGKNCASRAKLAREVGESRVKSADMAFNDASSDKIAAYNKQQDKVRKAQKEYMKDAKTDVSDADRADIKSSLMPRLKTLSGDLTGLIGTVTGLLSQVQQQVGGSFSLDTASIGGCARKAVEEGPAMATKASNLAENSSELLAPLTSLLSLLQSMASNVTGMISDISSL